MWQNSQCTILHRKYSFSELWSAYFRISTHFSFFILKHILGSYKSYVIYVLAAFMLFFSLSVLKTFLLSFQQHRLVKHPFPPLRVRAHRIKSQNRRCGLFWFIPAWKSKPAFDDKEIDFRKRRVAFREADFITLETPIWIRLWTPMVVSYFLTYD